MSLQNVLPWIKAAHRDGYAIAAFNANTMEQAQAIALGAQAENAPVIIQISHRAMQYAGSGSEVLGMQYLASVSKIAANSVDVPVAVHLDHANEQEVLQAIALGFTSVMFDGHHLSFEENAEISKRLSDYAKATGVCMEAEIGEVPKPDVAAYDPDDIALTTPDEADAFVRATDVDLLAVGVGAVHGVKVKSGKLDLARLQAIRARVETPLVSHGSSGLTDDTFSAGIKMGLAKVNIGTQMNKAFTSGVREVLSADEGLADPRKYLGSGRKAQIAVVRERLRFVGAAGKADQR